MIDFLPSTVSLVDGRVFVFFAIITRWWTGGRQNSGILAPRFSLFRLFGFRGHIPLPGVLEIGFSVALGLRATAADVTTYDAVFLQQVGDALVGDGLAPLPVRPWPLRVRRQALDNSLGGEIWPLLRILTQGCAVEHR